MTKSQTYKRRRAEQRRQEADAYVSAVAALRNSSRPGVDAQASNEVSTDPPIKLDDEDPRPIKKRVVAGQSQPTNVDEKTNETLHINDNRPLKAASYVTGSQTNNLDAITSQDNARDRKLASSVDQLPLYSSDPEINTLDQGSVRELSTFTPTKENVFGETTEEWSIRLNKTDRLTLIGQYDIWVRKGAVVVMGAVIHAGSTVHRVHAPSTHSLPVIRACNSPFMPDDQTAEITILSISISGIRQLKELSPNFVCIWNHRSLSNEQHSPKVDLSQRSFTFLKSSGDDHHRRPLYALECPIYWQREFNRFKNPLRKYPPTIMVCGLKGTGKSTFCRTLANTLLSNRANSTIKSHGFARRDHLANGIAFLDLDPGQPEYSPPGEVTLTYMRRFNLGVPYTHPMIGISEPNRLIRAHHIGAVSANDDPQHYQNCALDLFRHYQILLGEDPSCPLIVNCSGWVTASGLEVLIGLIQKMCLSDIVYTQGGNSEVASILGEAAAKIGATFQPLLSPQAPILTRNASELRMMQAQSYFHVEEPQSVYLGWNRTPLIEMPPLTVQYSGASQDIFAVMILGQEQDPESYKYILEGSVVGVVVLEDDTAIIGVNDNGQLGSVGALPLLEDLDSQNDGPLDSSGVGLHDRNGRDKNLRRESRYSGRFKIPHASGNDSISDEDSDVGDAPGSDESNFAALPRRRSSKSLVSRHNNPPPSQSSNEVVNHPLVSRTPEGLPYLYTGGGAGVQPALDPGKSYSLGQALIHGIDASSQMIYLYTPIPTCTLESLARQGSKIVLVRGALDMPTWAFSEEYHAMATRRKKSEPGRDGKGGKLLASETTDWVQRTPWAALKDEREEGSSARVRHSRRNLRTG